MFWVYLFVLQFCNKTYFCLLCTDHMLVKVFSVFRLKNTETFLRFLNSFSHGIIDNDCTCWTDKSFSGLPRSVLRGFLKWMNIFIGSMHMVFYTFTFWYEDFNVNPCFKYLFHCFGVLLAGCIFLLSYLSFSSDSFRLEGTKSNR